MSEHKPPMHEVRIDQDKIDEAARSSQDLPALIRVTVRGLEAGQVDAEGATKALQLAFHIGFAAGITETCAQLIEQGSNVDIGHIDDDDGSRPPDNE